MRMAGVFKRLRAYVGWAARLPLRLIPDGARLRILSGRLRGKAWVASAATHGAWLGIYEAETQEALCRHVRPGDVVYDIGANAGFFTLLASVLVGENGQVVAFEPLPQNIGFLRRHLVLNGVENVQVMEAAVADVPGIASFTCQGDAAQGALSETDTGLRVQVVTLDALVRDEIIRPPCVMKMDIEGAESRALAGADEVLIHGVLSDCA